ncbi:MAG: substrate-binding domain-containing protein [Ruminococcus sp.]|uniref:Extracellular solute-binding protein n=1 Tax=Ruminococcus bicirculans (ex Wegman et al. 2014) TaxID=1160721 RepID=A0AAW6E4I7_9FIRM|nr:substrate-binding domain-containing protein [Ruminococcus bicirculans (ex Wegman et al. 2014)]MBP6257981.1 extracellular solute-binding protein [Ruminococcus sp.]MBS6200395.1 extracellular solute-binding protein [Ruminococcus bicirculans (ex Wegman et al. 2014)]MBS6919751.1 extracellular solute-binding protein [Ruminococcus bicirculans (ex Wegman et al. 2014)]MDB8736701.1 extracellular solute-binding protein [Ruminococcus bicirculans (ex Wegman et al. 2014)]MDB8743315.1 extracellular solute
MKTRTSKLAAIFTSVALAATMLASCGGSSDKITVISREDGSGTRGAFIELTGIEEKDSNGNKTDNTKKDALICKSTDVVLTQVSGDKNAIGYISFGSLNDTVKALKVEGVEPSTATIESGDYKIVRPFNIAVKDGLSDAAQDFENYILSSDGQDIIEKAGYIKIDKSAAAYASNNASGKVVVSGSSSVTPVMEKLAEAYQKANTNVTVDVQQSDSSTGIKDAINGTSDIGMASRDISDDELSQGIKSVTIAQDAIAVIVNKDNAVEDITMDEIKSIYTGSKTTWSDESK